MIIDFRMRPPARGFLNIGVYNNFARPAHLSEFCSRNPGPSVSH